MLGWEAMAEQGGAIVVQQAAEDPCLHNFVLLCWVIALHRPKGGCAVSLFVVGWCVLCGTLSLVGLVYLSLTKGNDACRRLRLGLGSGA